MKTRYKHAIFAFLSFFTIEVGFNLFDAINSKTFNEVTFLKIALHESVTGLFFAILALSGYSMIYDMRGTRLAKINVKEELEAGEQILLETIAIRSKMNDSAEGKLALTNRRIVFIPNRWKRSNPPLLFPLETIELVKQRRFLWLFFSYGLTFKTTGGSKERFIIDDLKPWTEMLKQQHIGLAA